MLRLSSSSNPCPGVSNSWCLFGVLIFKKCGIYQPGYVRDFDLRVQVMVGQDDDRVSLDEVGIDRFGAGGNVFKLLSAIDVKEK
jgi:hypothetical protein